MIINREALFAGVAILGIAFCAPAFAGPAAASHEIVAQASSGPLLSGTPEPTEEPTAPPSDALVAAAAVGPEWNAYAQLVENANTFIETIHSKQNRGDVKFDKILKVTSRKPNFARCDIIGGDGVGSAVVWRGGTKVQAHEGGEHAAIIVVLPRHNKRVTDLVGYGCGDTTPDAVVGYTTAHGKLSEAAGPTIDGNATDDITWVVNPGDQIYVTKEDFFIDKTTHLIVASKGYHDGDLIEDSTWQIQVNPTVPYTTFDMGG